MQSAILLIIIFFASVCSAYGADTKSDDLPDLSTISRSAENYSSDQLLDSAFNAVKHERYDKAAAYYSLAASGYNESLPQADIRRCAIACVNMGYIWLAWRMNAAEAYPWLMKAQKIASRHNLPEIETAVISNLGQLYFDYNNIPRATEKLQLAFERVMDEKGDRYFGRSLMDLATVAIFSRQKELLADMLKKAKSYPLPADAPLAEYSARLIQALTAYSNGDPARGAAILTDAEKLFNVDSDRKRYLTMHSIILGEMWMDAGEYAKASENLKLAGDIASKEGFFNLMEKSYTDLAECRKLLGDPTDENTLVAFQALSGEEESLYYLWTIDDVTFMTAEEAAGRRLTASSAPAGFTKPVNMAVRRPFHPTSTRMAVRQLPESEWLNAGNITYRVYLDDEPVGDYLKARSFTDYNHKDPGTHTYRVMAWSEALDQEYDEAEIDVNIGEVVFPEPRNVVAEYVEEDEGRYTILATWEAPDSDIVPDHYNIYVNGKSMGWIDATEELSIGQMGLYRGAYTFEIEAVYKYPEGESARVAASVFPGTVPTPASLKAERDGNGYILTWEGVPYEGQQPESFFITRGDELIAEGVTECRYVDRESPKANFHYNVHAVYDGGEYSLPSSVFRNDRVEQVLQLPVSADFNFGHLPADWSVTLVDAYDRVKDMYSWRFDNWFEHEFEAEGFVDGFASISGVIASMNKLESYLVSPLFAVPANGDVQVSFMKYFEEEKAGPAGPAQFTLEGRAEEDAEWELIANLTEESDGELIYPLSSYAGKNIMLRWGFNGRNSGMAAVDEINIYDAGSGVDFILNENESVDIYNIGGILLRSGVKASEVNALPAGIYLLRTASGAVFKRMTI